MFYCTKYVLILIFLLYVLCCKESSLSSIDTKTIKQNKIATTCLAGTQILQEFPIDIQKKIIAVPYLMDNPQYSFQVDHWKKAKRIRNLVDDLVELEPNIVIIANYQKERLKNHLTSLGIHVVTLEPSVSFNSYIRNVSKIAKVLHRTTVSKNLIAQFQEKIQRIKWEIKSKKKPKNINILPYVYQNVLGDKTIINEIISLLQWNNVARIQGGIKGYKKISTEKIILWNPDVILTSCYKNCDTIKKNILNNKNFRHIHAIKNKKIITIDNAIFSSTNQKMLEIAFILLNEVQ